MLNEFLGVDGVEVISLSHRFAEGEVRHYPGDPEYRSEPVAALERDGYVLNYVSVGEHTGTHWGAPSHFNEGEAAAHELNPEDFFLPGVLIDVQRQAEQDDDYAVSVSDLEAWEAAHGPFPAECAVLLNTGWHKRWPTTRYDNLDANGIPVIQASHQTRRDG